MNQTTKICLILILLIINGCSMAHDKKEINTATKQMVNKENLEKYKQQEHRLAFNGCELTYNEKPFYLGQQIENIIKVLGPYTRKLHKYGAIGFAWDELGIHVFISTMDSKGNNIPKKKQSVSSLKVKFKHNKIELTYTETLKASMQQTRKDFPINKDYILVNGIPLKRETIMKDYMKQTGKDFSFFTSRSRSGYGKLYRDCQAYPSKNIRYSFSTNVDFESKDYGRVAITGKPIHGTHEVTSFGVSLYDKKDEDPIYK